MSIKPGARARLRGGDDTRGFAMRGVGKAGVEGVGSIDEGAPGEMIGHSTKCPLGGWFVFTLLKERGKVIRDGFGRWEGRGVEAGGDGAGDVVVRSGIVRGIAGGDGRTSGRESGVVFVQLCKEPGATWILASMRIPSISWYTYPYTWP